MQIALQLPSRHKPALLCEIQREGIFSTMSDNDAISNYLATKNPTYFAILYERYSAMVLRRCNFLLQDEEKAADATQDIFLKVMINLSKYSGKSKFSTWVYSITNNFCFDVIRKQNRYPSFQIDNIELINIKEDHTEDRHFLEERSQRLNIVLEKIPASDKSYLLMKYKEGLTIREIGATLDKSESAVKMKIKRARLKFKNIYDKLCREMELSY